MPLTHAASFQVEVVAPFSIFGDILAGFSQMVSAESVFLGRLSADSALVRIDRTSVSVRLIPASATPQQQKRYQPNVYYVSGRAFRRFPQREV
jgi:hypothetical protein